MISEGVLRPVGQPKALISGGLASPAGVASQRFLFVGTGLESHGGRPWMLRQLTEQLCLAGETGAKGENSRKALEQRPNHCGSAWPHCQMSKGRGSVDAHRKCISPFRGIGSPGPGLPVLIATIFAGRDQPATEQP